MEELLKLIASKSVVEASEKVKVIRLKELNGQLIGITSSRTDKKSFHVAGIDEYDYFCGCIGSKNGICSHIVALLRKSKNRERLIRKYVYNKVRPEMLTKEQLFAKLAEKGQLIPTSLRGINNQIGGLIKRCMTLLFGGAKVGKTILALQLAYEYMVKENKSIIYVGTEGGEETTLLAWKLQSFDERYKINPGIVRIIPKLKTEAIEQKDEEGAVKKRRKKVEFWNLEEQEIEKGDGKLNIYLLEARKAIPLLTLHGYSVIFEPTDSGKMMVRISNEMPPIETTPIGQLCAKRNVGMLVYDSISAPYEEFVGGMVNFPSRDDAEGLLFLQAQELCSKYNLVVLGIAQPTKNDADKYDIMYPIGGKAVHHNFKIWLKIDFFRNPTNRKPVSSLPNVNRRIILVDRFPALKTGTQAGRSVLEIDDNGYKDVDVIIEEEGEKE